MRPHPFPPARFVRLRRKVPRAHRRRSSQAMSLQVRRPGQVTTRTVAIWATKRRRILWLGGRRAPGHALMWHVRPGLAHTRPPSDRASMRPHRTPSAGSLAALAAQPERTDLGLARTRPQNATSLRQPLTRWANRVAQADGACRWTTRPQAPTATRHPMGTSTHQRATRWAGRRPRHGPRKHQPRLAQENTLLRA